MSISHTYGTITSERRKWVWETKQISLREDLLVAEAFNADGDLLVCCFLGRDMENQLEPFVNASNEDVITDEVMGPIYEWIHGELGWDRTRTRLLTGCRDGHYIFPKVMDAVSFYVSHGMTVSESKTDGGIVIYDFELLRENNTLLLENQEE